VRIFVFPWVFNLNLANSIGSINMFLLFFAKIVALLWKNYIMFFIQNIVHHWPTFSHLSGSIWILRRKKSASFEAFHESIHSFLSSYEENFCSDRPCVIGTSDNQTGQYQNSTAGGVGFPISASPSMFRWPAQHEVKHCFAGELLYHVFALALLRFSFNARLKRINWSWYRSV